MTSIYTPIYAPFQANTERYNITKGVLIFQLGLQSLNKYPSFNKEAHHNSGSIERE